MNNNFNFQAVYFIHKFNKNAGTLKLSSAVKTDAPKLTKNRKTTAEWTTRWARAPLRTSSLWRHSATRRGRKRTRTTRKTISNPCPFRKKISFARFECFLKLTLKLLSTKKKYFDRLQQYYYVIFIVKQIKVNFRILFKNLL